MVAGRGGRNDGTAPRRPNDFSMAWSVRDRTKTMLALGLLFMRGVERTGVGERDKGIIAFRELGGNMVVWSFVF